MIASTDDARLLFARWKEEAPALRATLRSATLIFEGTGTVVDHQPGAVQLGGPAWQLTIPLEGATFTFSDPREIPNAAIRDRETARYEFGLGVDFPNGDRLALLELKHTREPEEPGE